MKHNYDEPTMQAAIDAACKATASSTHRPLFALLSLEESDTNDDWPKEKPARLDLLKTALDHLPEPPPPESKTCSVCNWTNISLLNLGEPGDPRWVCPGCCKRAFDQTQPPVVDGKTPGQVCHESMYNTPEWKRLLAGDKAACESAASAVLAAFGNKPQPTGQHGPAGMPPLRGPGLILEPVETPEEIPWTAWHGGECPLKDEEVEEYEWKLRDGTIQPGSATNYGLFPPQGRKWNHIGNDFDIIAYRVTKWKEGFGPVDWKARAEKAEAELAKRINLVQQIKALQLSTLRLPESKAPDVAATAEVAKPETFEAHGKTWTRHAPGDPPPCDGDALIEWIFDSEYSGEVTFIPNQFRKAHALKSWSGIIGWRYADKVPEVIHEGGEVLQVALWTPQVGDVVTLKSGGPKMTVLDPHPICYCSWFSDGEFYSNNFPASTLIPA